MIRYFFDNFKGNTIDWNITGDDSNLHHLYGKARKYYLTTKL